MSEFDRYRDSYEEAVDDAIKFGGAEHAFCVDARLPKPSPSR